MLNITYQSILNRFSTRRYDTKPLTKEFLEELAAIQQWVAPLNAENDYQFSVYNFDGEYERMEIMGAFGATINAPHFILAHITGEEPLLADIGFRLEQVVLWLQDRNVGTCYVGCLRREDQLIQRFQLPDGARLGSLVVFGNPSLSVMGKGANKLIRSAAGATRRHPVEKIFFKTSFDHPANPPGFLAPIIEAGRYAPSAVNAQPWRFLLDGNNLYIYITRNNPKYSAGNSEQYCFFDGGIAMANIIQAAHSQGFQASWSLDTPLDIVLNNHNPPDNLEFLVRLEFD